MTTPYFGNISNRFRQNFTRIRRTTGLGLDTYGDATFTENRTTGFRGFSQFSKGPGQTVIVAGKELTYDLAVYASATFAVGEDDVILFGSSTATAVSTRYHVKAVRRVYDGSSIDHTEILCSQEVV